MDDALAAARLGIDVLVPLHKLEGEIWDTGWRKEILYIPTRDYGVLPPDVALSTAQTIIMQLEVGKRVGIFCMGGHGRTGYLAALVLGLGGIADPIAVLRKQYCNKAVESKAQITQIATLLGRPSLLEHKPREYPVVSSSSTRWDDWVNDRVPTQKKPQKPRNEPEYGSTCKSCAYFSDDPDIPVGPVCGRFGDSVRKSTRACGLFAPK